MAAPALSAKARAALDSICDTFAPGGDGLPSATELGVPEALLGLVGRNPRAAERKQVAQLLGVWDTRLLGAIAGAGARRFSSLTQGEREAVLLSWADSRLVQRRAAFQALRKGVLLAYYGMGGANGDRNPVWDAIGYPGPLGAPSNPPPRTIEPLSVTQDTTLDCDVVVVGSGAGGGTAAAVLAQAGLDVVIVEAGRYFSERDFDGAELSGFDRLYVNGGGMASADGSVGLLAAQGLGGTTLVNYTFCFRTPDNVRREWAVEHGVDAVAGEDYDRSVDAVWERIGVNAEYSLPSRRDEADARGPRQARLGLAGDAAQRARLHRGGLPPVSLRLSARRQAVDAQDLGPGRARRRHARARRDHAAERVLTEGGRGERRRGAHRRRAQGHGQGARGGERLRGAPHAGAAGALGRALARARQAPPPASGAGRSGVSSTSRSAPGRACCPRRSPTRTPTWTAAATASSTSTWRSRPASCCRSRPGAAGASTPS